MIDTVDMHANCYSYYLKPLIPKLRAMRDNEQIPYRSLVEEILAAIAPADNTRAKKNFIKRLQCDCYKKLDICQLVENSCEAAKKTQMKYYPAQITQ